MPTIQTLGQSYNNTEFTYSGSVKEGATLHFDKIDKVISAEFFKAILNCFKGATIPGDFSRAELSSGGLGIWIEYYSQQLNPVRLFPRHATYIAAILEHEGYITSSLEGNAIMLRFRNDYEL